LSRARRDLFEYLRGNCSLVVIEGGFVDPQKLQFKAG